MTRFKFGPASADEPIVFGARRPGYNSTCVEKEVVDEWIAFMQQRKIRRVVCLLDEKQLNYYEYVSTGLLDYYKDKSNFGKDMVLHEPVCDYHLAAPQQLKKICRFLMAACDGREKAVVHCSGGSGRTGHVLACWLVHARGYGPEQALQVVEQTCRNPKEAVHCRNAPEEHLMELLAGCRP